MRMVCALVWFGLALAGGAEAGVSFNSLLNELMDLDRLATFPDPPYTSAQFSSYDRASTDPAVATDGNWFANGDRGHFLREEPRNGATEYVLMDAAGPGAIVRIWSANPADAGMVRVYLDGAETPTIEAPLTALLGGEQFPFLAPLAGERSLGWNAHVPIPYGGHCKVTASQPDFYYHINYRTYAAGTEVETYTAAVAEAAGDLVRQTAAALANPAADIRTDGLARVVIEPGQRVQRTQETGNPGAVYGIRCRVAAADVAAALRGCWLEIAFDGQAPSVRAPLGDFFGSAPGLNPYAGWPCGMLADGTLYSRWVMPFRQSYTISVVNTTDTPVTLDYAIDGRGRAWTDDSLYFHATWREERGIATQPRQDWTLLDARGTGRYVGNALHIANPVEAWWGEGDEKVYVDGEAFPSTFGTGTEDYYGYAWCSNAVFSHAYHNQPRCDGPGNYGHTSVNRFHIVDDIPFGESLRFDLEVWHWTACRVDMASVAYFYLAPGGTGTRTGPVPAGLSVPVVPPMPEPERVEGAIEGESLEVVEKTGGTAQVQRSSVWPWSNAAQIWWTGGQPGDSLTLGFEVEQAGRYEVIAVFTTAPDYGIAQIAINGREVAVPLDFYHPSVVPTAPVSLGVHALDAGRNTFTATLRGSNAAALPAYMFGLDYLRLALVE